MDLTSRRVAAFVALLAVTACAPAIGPDERPATLPSPPDSRMVDSEADRAAAIAQLMPCRVTNQAPHAGAEATPSRLERMRIESGAAVLRVVSTGQPAATDHDTARLTVETDAAGRILRSYCG